MVNKIKILVCSDSHGRLGMMITAVEREQPDHIFFLGDCYEDSEALARACPGIPISAVKGNCDWCAGPEELTVELGGVRFMLTHGHLRYVKSRLDRLAEAGLRCGADMVCFGHTHTALYEQASNGVWLFNPGTAGGINARPGYGILEVEQGKVTGWLR